MKSIKDDVFRLPVDNDGNLDWAYMDEYMSTVLKEVEATLENLSSVAFYKVEPRKPAVLTAGMIGAQIPFAQTRAKHASSKRTV